jgi:nicotinamidase-related amidase
VQVKRRVSAFHGTELGVLLTSQNIRHLIMFGVSTGGCVLSTLRAAADADYVCTVLGDVCFDVDAEVHSCLLAKVFPRQSLVIGGKDFVDAMKLRAQALAAAAAAQAAAAQAAHDVDS